MTNTSPVDSKSIRLLIILSSLPKYNRSAGCLRMSYLLEKLALHYTVDVVVQWDETGGTSQYSAEEIEEYRQHLTESGARLVGRGILGIVDVLSSCRYHIICFEFFHMATKYMEMSRRLQAGARLVVDSVDVHYLREAAGAKLGLYDWKVVAETKKRELNAYRRSDAVIAISDPDQQALLAEGGMPPMFLIPIVLRVYPRPAMQRAPEVVFVGGFGHPPNADGVCWFVREIWGAVRAAVPEAHFTIIGGHPTPEVLELGKVEGVSVLGFVPEVRPYLDRAAVSVAPLRYGGGMKGKVTEAMSVGIPIVTTTFGAQGFDVVSGQQMMLADEPAEFARAVIHLLQHPEEAERIGLAGQQTMAAFCSLEAAEKTLCAMVDQLVSRPVRSIGTFTQPAYRLGVRLSLAAARRLPLSLREKFR